MQNSANNVSCRDTNNYVNHRDSTQHSFPPKHASQELQHAGHASQELQHAGHASQELPLQSALSHPRRAVETGERRGQDERGTVYTQTQNSYRRHKLPQETNQW